MTPIVEKPEPPAPHECCGGGSCCPCVWDRYYDELAAWREQQAAQAEASAPVTSNDSAA
ncbi:oxidoreductase-like domain-containing protein [Motiliproteus sediminis]|uniref:oxidoreductase-like domain-containing protein n=1 Tax=Motiliproteus sediminis TaxID=1468178 RepID=UPI001AEF933F|nr:oxidoreductase-like domain-containing protein [Motiliproteus sediminis]